MNRTQKQTEIESLREEFTQAPHAILVDFTGLTVPRATEFRRRIRKSGCGYRVVKNTLALRAIQGTPLEMVKQGFSGMTGVAYSREDPVVLAKVLIDFNKENPNLVVKAGLLAGSQILDADGVKALSSMPGLPEMRARLLGVLMAPMAQLVRLLDAPATQLARVFDERRKKIGGAHAGRAKTPAAERYQGRELLSLTTTTSPGEAVEELFEKAVPQSPEVAVDRVKREFEGLKGAWGSRELLCESESDLKSRVLSNLERTARETGFKRFDVNIAGAMGCAQIVSSSDGDTATSVCVWTTSGGLYICGNANFK
ncbi:MAG: 50S ribosomal protein L10 [Vicinamibacteria bacterium]|nr:50S ribosomal protein L10 [Vicinamibacteria bacterium]